MPAPPFGKTIQEAHGVLWTPSVTSPAIWFDATASGTLVGGASGSALTSWTGAAPTATFSATNNTGVNTPEIGGPDTGVPGIGAKRAVFFNRDHFFAGGSTPAYSVCDYLSMNGIPFENQSVWTLLVASANRTPYGQYEGSMGLFHQWNGVVSSAGTWNICSYNLNVPRFYCGVVGTANIPELPGRVGSLDKVNVWGFSRTVATSMTSYLNGKVSEVSGVTAALFGAPGNATYMGKMPDVNASVPATAETPFIGPIGEVLGYNRVLSAREFNLVHGYLGWKWGSSIDPANPFFTRPPTLSDAG